MESLSKYEAKKLEAKRAEALTKLQTQEERWNAMSPTEHQRLLAEAQDSLKKTHDWTRHCDFKTAPFLAAVLTILTFGLKETIDNALFLRNHLVLAFFWAIAILAFLFSAACLIVSIQPRLTNDHPDIFKPPAKPQETDTIFFFGHIALHEDADDYREHFLEKSGSFELFRQYTDQNLLSSKICSDKFKRSGLGIQLLSLGIVISILLGLVIIYMNLYPELYNMTPNGPIK
jgi:hypothetical protein